MKRKSISCLFNSALSPDEYQKMISDSHPSLIPTKDKEIKAYVNKGSILYMFLIECCDEYYQIIVPEKDGFILYHLARLLPIEHFMAVIDDLVEP